MEKLINGVSRFKSEVFGPRQELFASLALGQHPEALFITCSDSRINPNLITQTEPGDLFILRTAGNIVPPYGAPSVGEAATIEYAIEALQIHNIIVCGHTHCGAMHALVHPEATEGMPAVRALLSHAEAARRIVQSDGRDLEEKAKVRFAIEQNVLVQIQNLRTHPSVSAALARGQLSIYGWVYDIKQGGISAFDAAAGCFVPLSRLHIGSLPTPERLGQPNAL